MRRPGWLARCLRESLWCSGCSSSELSCGDSPASMIDTGAEASTNTSDIAADPAAIACSGTVDTARYQRRSRGCRRETAECSEYDCAATYYA